MDISQGRYCSNVIENVSNLAPLFLSSSPKGFEALSCPEQSDGHAVTQWNKDEDK